VAINQRTIYRSVEPADVDIPPSTVLLFNLEDGTLQASVQLPIEKVSNSLQPLPKGRFLIKNESGIQVCNDHLSCEAPIPAEGPLLVSPAGSTVAVGGYGQTDQRLLNGNSLAEIGRFKWGDPGIYPGDGLVLLKYANEKDRRLHVKEKNDPERILPFEEGAGNQLLFPTSRFLSGSTIGISESVNSLLVARTDGTLLYHVPVASWYRGTTLVPSACGTRFVLRESDYTRWNSITNFTDIDSSRPFNFEKIRVLDLETGRPLLTLQWDPRPYIPQLTLPAISPNGHRLAAIRRGFLEVYDVK